jgi:hypothetical protein
MTNKIVYIFNVIMLNNTFLLTRTAKSLVSCGNPESTEI